MPSRKRITLDKSAFKLTELAVFKILGIAVGTENQNSKTVNLDKNLYFKMLGNYFLIYLKGHRFTLNVIVNYHYSKLHKKENINLILGHLEVLLWTFTYGDI